MRFLLIDHHELFRNGLHFLLQEAFEGVEIKETSNFNDALHIVQSEQFNLILCELLMVDMSIFAGINKILGVERTAKVAVVSGNEDIEVIEKIFSLGVVGYLPKNLTSGLILSAINLILSGGIYVPPIFLNIYKNSKKVGQKPKKPPFSLNQLPLTPRQRELALLLSTGNQMPSLLTSWESLKVQSESTLAPYFVL